MVKHSVCDGSAAEDVDANARRKDPKKKSARVTSKQLQEEAKLYRSSVENAHDSDEMTGNMSFIHEKAYFCNMLVLHDPDRKQWDWFRLRCADILEHTFCDGEAHVFESLVGVVIIINIVIMIIETDARADCLNSGTTCMPGWITSLNYIFVAVYTGEALLRLIVLRWRIALSLWNVFDLLIVVTAWCDLLISDDASTASKNIQMLRVTRVARVVRMAKIISKFPTLNTMVRGFNGAMNAMAWGLIVILILLIIWSILAVELFHPINQNLYAEEPDHFCFDAFSSVLRSTLVFFQTLIAGDSWGFCAIPVIQKAPMTFIVFAASLVSVQLGFTNLVLAIIVDKASEARECSKDSQLKAKRKETRNRMQMWAHIAESLDQDGDGLLSKEEMVASADDPYLAEVWEMLDIDLKDLEEVYGLLDTNGDGKVTFQCVVDAFSKTQQEMRVYLMLMKLQVSKLQVDMATMLEKMDTLVGKAARSSFMSPSHSHPPGSPPGGAPAVSQEVVATGIPSAFKAVGSRGLDKGCCSGMTAAAFTDCGADAITQLHSGLDVGTLQRRLDALAAEAAEIAGVAAGKAATEAISRLSGEAAAQAQPAVSGQAQATGASVKSSDWATTQKVGWAKQDITADDTLDDGDAVVQGASSSAIKKKKPRPKKQSNASSSR